MASLPIERMISDREFFAEPRASPLKKSDGGLSRCRCSPFPPHASPLCSQVGHLYSARKKGRTIEHSSIRDSVRNRCFCGLIMEEAQFPKGDTWSVHKFGGTCVGNSQRIKNVASIIVQDTFERKLGVVSAMSKLTDMMYDLINKAQSRDDSYVFAVDSVLEKHRC